jgi:tetratricopeptide (TPR) repeat protein
MTLIFKTTKGPNSLGYFEPSNPAVWQRHHKTLNKLFDDLNSKTISHKQCMSRCLDILDKEPSFLGALTLLIDCLVEENVKLNTDILDIISNYLIPVRKLIPENFTKALDVDKEENIYFLSSHLYLLFTLLSLERYSEALEVYSEHQRWQKDTNAAAIVGNIHIIAGDLDKAEKVFSTYPVPMPYESAFSLGLIKFLKGELSEAATILRKAIILQPYVPEIILNNSAAVNYSWNYAENEGMFSNAQIYCNNFLGQRVWSDEVESLAFLEWLYTSPDMMAERAKALGFLNRMLYLKAGQEEEAKHLLGEFIRFASNPNPSLIRKLLKKVPHEIGLINPWELYLFSDAVDKIIDASLKAFNVESSENSSLNDIQEAGQFLEALDEHSDCGDCEKCEIFEECSISPSIDVESCHECDECEIKDFCRSDLDISEDLDKKKPPVRH